MKIAIAFANKIAVFIANTLDIILDAKGRVFHRVLHLPFLGFVEDLVIRNEISIHVLGNGNIDIHNGSSLSVLK